MKVLAMNYNKNEFIKFLTKLNCDDAIINKFIELPELVKRNGNTYEIYINTTWYNIDRPYYNFELNYYSEYLNEFLFNTKILNKVELSINNLLYELTNAKLITRK